MGLNRTTCPFCREEIDSTFLFCPHCGKNLRESSSLSTSFAKQVLIYFVSFFLSPLGLWWGFRYLRQEDSKAKRIGVISILLTVTAIILAVLIIKVALNYTTNSLDTQFKQYQELGL